MVLGMPSVELLNIDPQKLLIVSTLIVSITSQSIQDPPISVVFKLSSTRITCGFQAFYKV